MDKDINYYYQQLIDSGIATESEVELVCNINGFSMDTLNDILYAKVGCNDVEDYFGN